MCVYPVHSVWRVPLSGESYHPPPPPRSSAHLWFFHSHAQEAAAEFKRHGLDQLITVQQRNIEEQGFPQVRRVVGGG